MPTPTPTPEAKKVSIGPTTWAGWISSFLLLAPTAVKDVEAGEVAMRGPEKYAAIAGVIALAITQIGRYVQAAKL
jgi:hypothetical protein